MAVKKAALITSKASKPKNRKWDSWQRFSAGHDSASTALLPESEIIRLKTKRATKRAGGVWRSPSFGKTREELVYESAQRLIKAGRVNSIEEAVEKAQQALDASWGAQVGTETFVVVDKSC